LRSFAAACDKGPLISERPQGFVGLVAQLPIAHRADRSTTILSILDAKHQAKARRHLVAVAPVVRRRSMMAAGVQRTPCDMAAMMD
jgi:hypothetical protein